MVKIDFLSVNEIPEATAMAQLVAQHFDLVTADVQATMRAREKLGSTMIATDIFMPHVELPNVAIQGLFLITNQQQIVLILIIDSVQPDEQLVALLTNLLVEPVLAKLKQVSSQEELNTLIKEVNEHVIR